MPELVRYMHVDSLRGWMVEELKELVGCPEATHSGIVERTNRPRQVVRWVLAQFGRRVAEERGLVCFWAYRI
jgi:hypothetical protein